MQLRTVTSKFRATGSSINICADIGRQKAKASQNYKRCFTITQADPKNSTFNFAQPHPKPTHHPEKLLRNFTTFLYRLWIFFLHSPIIVKSKQSTLKTIGTTLRELRETKGLLLREVGAKLSLDPTILSKIERDERMPTREQVKALADFYKDQKNEVIIAWLSDKLYYEVQYEDLALQAMQVAEEKIKYNKKKK